MTQVSHIRKTILGMDVRSHACALSIWNPHTMSSEKLAEFCLPGDISREAFLSETDAFAEVFDQLGQELSWRGAERPKYVLCIPDSFTIKDRMRLRKMAEASGIGIGHLISESDAAAIASLRTDSHEGLKMIVNLQKLHVTCSLYSIEDHMLELLEKSSCSRGGRLEVALYQCMQRFSGTAFMDRGVFSAPGTVLLIGTDGEASMAEIILRRWLNGLAGSERTRFYISGASGDIYARGTGLYAGMLEGYLRPVFRETLMPHCVYVGGDEIIRQLPRESRIPFEKVLPVSDKATGSGRMLLYEQLEDGSLEAFADCAVQSRDSSDIAEVHVVCDSEKHFSIRSGEEGDGPDAKDSVTRPVEREEETDLLLRFVEVADSLEYGMQGIQDPEDPHLVGLRHIFRQMTDTFAACGLERYGEAGETFDPQIHNAVVHVTDIDLPENCIRQVVQSGYRKDGKILRYASVVVAN